jgi:hypothetical protein
MREPTTAEETRRRYGVPEGVRLRVDERGAVAWVDGAEAAALAVDAEPDALPRDGDLPAGRAPLARVDSEVGPLLVREATKGGLLRRLRGARFHGRWRPLD